MSGRVPIKYYWDSCVFLAHLKKETDKHPKSIPIIAELMNLNKLGESTVVGSQVVRIEVLEFNLDAEQRASFGQFYSGKNQIWDVDSRVADLSREIRDFYKRNPIVMPNGNKRGIKTPDAIHLATAINHNVDEFHTLDGGGQDGFSLLSLGDTVAGKYALDIRRPRRPPEHRRVEEDADEQGRLWGDDPN